MEIEELRQFIELSEFSPETKQKVAIVLGGKAVLDYDTYSAVKQILQQELDDDFENDGVEVENDGTELEQIEQDYQDDLQSVNDAVEEDTKFIDDQAKKLDEMATDFQNTHNGA